MKYTATTQIELQLNAYDRKHAEKIINEHLQEAVENMKWDHVLAASLTRPKIYER